jgi:predicted RNA-binding protein YlqC (UPF0109 family)
MRELIELLTRSLVDMPDAVDVREIEDQDLLIIEVRVAPDDVGKIIGRQGRTIKALRTLAHAAAIKSQQRVQVEVVEDAPGDQRGPGPEHAGA